MDETTKEATAQNPPGQSKGPKFWQNSHCSCGCGHGFGHGLLRGLLMIIILLIVFWLGVMVGSHRGFYGRRDYMTRPYPMTRIHSISGISPAHPITPTNPAGSAPTSTSTQ